MRRGGNWLSGFQHLSYSGRGESRSSTARFHVGNAKKSIEITDGGFVGQNSTCVWFVLCVVIRIVRPDKSQWPITDTRIDIHTSPSMQSVNGNAVPAQDTHTPWYYRGIETFKWVSCNCVNTEYWGDEGWEWDLESVRLTGNTSLITTDNSETISNKLSQHKISSDCSAMSIPVHDPISFRRRAWIIWLFSRYHYYNVP